MKRPFNSVTRENQPAVKKIRRESERIKEKQRARFCDLEFFAQFIILEILQHCSLPILSRMSRVGLYVKPFVDDFMAILTTLTIKLVEILF